MKITEKRSGERLTLELFGRLDTETSPELEKRLDAGLDGAKELILDCKYLEYVSSSGLRAILRAAKLMSGAGGKLRIENTNELVAQVLQVAGFYELLNAR